MPKNALKIDANYESYWFGWPQKKTLASGESVRALPVGEQRVLELDCDRSQKSFVALQFAGDLTPEDVRALHAKVDERLVEPFFNPVFPRFVLFCPDLLKSQGAFGPIRFEIEHRAGTRNAAKPELELVSVFFLPARGMFSKVWASKKRIAVAKKAGGKPEWHPEDFPYSHFDGMAYLQLSQAAAQSISEGEVSSAIEFFHKDRNAGRGAPPLAWRSSPNPGNLPNILEAALRIPSMEDGISELKSELAKSQQRFKEAHKDKSNLKEENELLIRQIRQIQAELEKIHQEKGKVAKERDALQEHKKQNDLLLKEHKEQNDLLLGQLHMVQEELEQYFLKNKELKSEKDTLDARHSTLDSEKKALDARLSTLIAERDELTTSHSSLVTERDALSVRLSTLVSERDALSAKHSELTTSHSTLVTERDALQKDLAASKTSAAEIEKKRADLVAERSTLDARLSTLIAERDALSAKHSELTTSHSTLDSEKKALAAERDQFKKTAADRAARIAELEAQIADQAERQKLIDEQMVRAETQLEMLKEFLQPAFK
jgi:chromosome segregation ATPase